MLLQIALHIQERCGKTRTPLQTLLAILARRPLEESRPLLMPPTKRETVFWSGRSAGGQAPRCTTRMNCYQKTWLPALPLEESNRQSHTALAPGFRYSGCVLTRSVKQTQPKHTAPLSRPHSVGGVSRLAGSSLGTTSTVAIDSRPPWYSSLSPFDRSIPQLPEEMAAPSSAAGRRLLRSLSSADDMRRRARKEKAYAAPHRRAARYGASVRQHVAGAALLEAIERREKYGAWTRALLQQNVAAHPSTEQAQRQLLARLREDVLAVLSSLSVATLQVLEAVGLTLETM